MCISVPLKHTWNNSLCLLFSHVFQKKTRLLTRVALWILFRVLKRVTFRTSPTVHYQIFVQPISRQFFIY